MTEEPPSSPIKRSGQRSIIGYCLRLGVALVFCLSPALLMGRTIVGAASKATQATQGSQVSPTRLARLRHGINLSHWFAQSPNGDYSEKHLDTFTTEQDLALIKSMGFDHVRFTVEPAPLIDPGDPGTLKKDYLVRFDHALDLILAQGLAVIVDIHPSDEFKLRLKDDRNVENFAKFWRALAVHLAGRDPERVFLEPINEPMVEDPYRWYGIQAKLIAAIRAGAPKHTIIASGYRWSGLWEFLALEPYSDANVIYNFHFYEPFVFTHQGANWAGPNLQFYRSVPYPSSPEAIARMLDTVMDDSARLVLVNYGQDHWDASRIDKAIGAAAAWGEKHHVPVTCNEFGVYRRFSLPADRATWITDMRVAFEKHGIGWTMWDYGGGFGVINRENGRTIPDAATVQALGLKSAQN